MTLAYHCEWITIDSKPYKPGLIRRSLLRLSGGQHENMHNINCALLKIIIRPHNEHNFDRLRTHNILWIEYINDGQLIIEQCRVLSKNGKKIVVSFNKPILMPDIKQFAYLKLEL